MENQAVMRFMAFVLAPLRFKTGRFYSDALVTARGRP